MYVSSWMGSLLDPKANPTVRLIHAIMLSHMISQTYGKMMREARFKSRRTAMASCATQLMLLRTNLILEITGGGDESAKKSPSVSRGMPQRTFGDLIKKAVTNTPTTISCPSWSRKTLELARLGFGNLDPRDGGNAC